MTKFSSAVPDEVMSTHIGLSSGHAIVGGEVLLSDRGSPDRRAYDPARRHKLG